MSEEVHNSRVIRISASLPGRGSDDDGEHIGIMTDGSRGPSQWGPDSDASQTKGRTVYHSDWQSALSAIQNPAREIHDFYFRPHIPSQTCGCCAGSGKNPEYQELYEGFYRGGRWSGWGSIGPFFDDELDYLFERGRFGSAPRSKITPGNFRQHLDTFFGMDSADHYFLTPIRARHLGISTDDCEECLGNGMAPTGPARISLNMWTFDPDGGTSRIDVAEDVRMDELEEARSYLAEVGWEGVVRRFGWAVGDNLHTAIPYSQRFVAEPGRTFRSSKRDPWYDQNIYFERFDQFAQAYDLGDPDRWSRLDDYNLVFDCRVIAPMGYEQDNPFAASELPEFFGLEIWMTHPRKTADRMIIVNDCTREDGELVRDMLQRSFAVHGRHFSWAVGREFGNEEKPDEFSVDTDQDYSPMKFFAGI